MLDWCTPNVCLLEEGRRRTAPRGATQTLEEVSTQGEKQQESLIGTSAWVQTLEY